MHLQVEVFVLLGCDAASMRIGVRRFGTACRVNVHKELTDTNMFETRRHIQNSAVHNYTVAKSLKKNKKLATYQFHKHQ